jgi:hypothetical protein
MTRIYTWTGGMMQPTTRMHGKHLSKWKIFWDLLGLQTGGLVVYLSPLFVGKYLSYAWGGMAALVVIAVLLYLGFKSRIVGTIRLIWLIGLAGEMIFALFLFRHMK